MENQPNKVQVEVIPNGPLKVSATCAVAMPSGETVEKENASFFCRCGFSENKPFCDGQHRAHGFEG